MVNGMKVNARGRGSWEGRQTRGHGGERMVVGRWQIE